MQAIGLDLYSLFRKYLECQARKLLLPLRMLHHVTKHSPLSRFSGNCELASWNLFPDGNAAMLWE